MYDWSVATEIFKKVKEAHPEMTPLYLQGSASPVSYTHLDVYKRQAKLLSPFGVEVKEYRRWKEC